MKDSRNSRDPTRTTRLLANRQNDMVFTSPFSFTLSILGGRLGCCQREMATEEGKKEKKVEGGKVPGRRTF